MYHKLEIRQKDHRIHLLNNTHYDVRIVYISEIILDLGLNEFIANYIIHHSLYPSFFEKIKC